MEMTHGWQIIKSFASAVKELSNSISATSRLAMTIKHTNSIALNVSLKMENIFRLIKNKNVSQLKMKHLESWLDGLPQPHNIKT
jgi:hypothetical protein